MPRITHLKLFCVPVRSDAALRFELLESVELTDFSCPATVDPCFLHTLFAIAINMRFLRLGALLPFPLPPSFRLYSASLRVLDIEFYHGSFSAELLSALDAPLLADLTVREVYQYVHSLLASPGVLSQITHFRVYSDIGDEVSLHQLFSALPRLRVLDLLHAHSHVFDAYSLWAASPLRSELPNTTANLKELHLGKVGLEAVLALVRFVMQSSSGSCTSTGLRKVRVRGPRALLPCHWMRWSCRTLLMILHLLTSIVLLLISTLPQRTLCFDTHIIRLLLLI